MTTLDMCWDDMCCDFYTSLHSGIWATVRPLHIPLHMPMTVRQTCAGQGSCHAAAGEGGQSGALAADLRPDAEEDDGPGRSGGAGRGRARAVTVSVCRHAEGCLSAGGQSGKKHRMHETPSAACTEGVPAGGCSAWSAVPLFARGVAACCEGMRSVVRVHTHGVLPCLCADSG